jgi:Na+-translocating ferredoxin:NAD+ oxidoreductase subunit B
MNLVIPSILALVLIGLISAVLLATAAQKFHVEVDPKVQAILDALPGANCGACGNPSCYAAAEAMAAGRAPITTCVAGGQSVADHVASVMGEDACEMVAVVSTRHCGGGTAAQHIFKYAGVESCNAVSKLAGGSLHCAYGCFGYGDCMRACPFDAITMDERQLPVIDLAKCTGCGVCVTECPRGAADLLQLIDENGPVTVRCASHERVPGRKAGCPNCCISCRKCEKACPSDAIHVIDMLAVVDYDKCTACYACVEVCPPKCIDVTGMKSGLAAAVTDGRADTYEGFESCAPAAAGEAAEEEAVEQA